MSDLNLREYIRDIPDFPKPGILFRDITPLLAHPWAFSTAIDQLADRYADRGIDCVVAIESRGFLFGAPLALRLGTALVPVRKPGKLPFDRYSYSYDLEYGSDTLEIHSDAIRPGQRVLVVDDLLATGGTVHACAKLLENFPLDIVEFAFCVELKSLGGARLLAPHPVYSLIEY